MKSKNQAKYRRSLLYQTLISTLAALAAEVLLVLNTSLLARFLSAFGFRSAPPESRDGREAVIFLYALIGILVFAAVFALLQRRTIRYTREISRTLKNISEGDFSGRLPLIGDNELSDIALQVNHMSEEISSLIEREKQAEQTKNDLITNVAHDLRTPLTSIIGYLDLLQSGKDIAPEARQQYLRIAHDKAKYLQQMIEDLFGLTKLGYSEHTTKLEPLDLVQLLGQLLEEFYPVFEQNGMDYEYYPQVQHCVIRGDGKLLARLFDNLINNGVKYGKEGKLLRVELTQKDDCAIVRVINYGKVIPQEDLDRLFEKFYRGDASRNSQVAGTGLGLSIAANIASAHGGSITVGSSLKGTVFTVTLPVSGPLENKEDTAKGGGE